MTTARRIISPDHPLRFGLALGLCHALLFGLAFPPVSLWPLAYVAIVPLVVCAAKATRPFRTALGVWLAALPMWALHEAWLVDVTIAGYPLLAAYLSLWTALFVWLGARLRLGSMRAYQPLWWLFMPLLWMGLETLRAQVVFDGYPWFLLAQPLGRPLSWAAPSTVMSLASLIGVTGVSLIVALLQTPLSWAIATGHARRITMGAGALVVGVFAVGFIGAVAGRPTEGPAPEVVRFGVVQTNVPQDNKLGWSPAQRRADFDEFKRYTHALVDSGLPLDAIVWPETMFPGEGLDAQVSDEVRAAGLVYQDTGDALIDFTDELVALQAELGVPMLVGSIGYENFRIDFDLDDPFLFESKFNSVFLIANGAVHPDRYDKLHLTPFGEVMPYISRFPDLERALLDLGARGMRFDLDRGRAPVVIETPTIDDGPPVRVVTPICFEATNASVMRDLVRAGGEWAEVIVHVTNDGWFGRFPGGREQHAQLARLRAIELGTPVVRAANTGISVAFDHAGERVDLLPVANGPERQVPLLPAGAWGAAIAELRPASTESPTLFARSGDVAAPFLMAMALAGLALAFTPPRDDRD
jgi:apolipoprotein N-acyltransferase